MKLFWHNLRMLCFQVEKMGAKRLHILCHIQLTWLHDLDNAINCALLTTIHYLVSNNNKIHLTGKANATSAHVIF
jgi:hypothetical protein